MYNTVASVAALEYLRRFTHAVELFNKHGLPMAVEAEDQKLFLQAMGVLNLIFEKRK